MEDKVTKFDPYYECQKCGSNNISCVGRTPDHNEHILGYLVYECKDCDNTMISDDADQLFNTKGEFKRFK